MISPTGRLVMTAEQMNSDREAWLTARRRNAAGEWCIGSSEVPSILDLDGVGTPVHVWRSKVLGVKMPVTERMEWGHLFEDVIAQEWCRRNRTVVDEIGLVARVDKPWRQTTIDRRVRECPAVPGLRDGCGLEEKNVGFLSHERWGRDLPDRILAQIIDQILVTGYDHMHYACNIGGNQLKQGIVWREREAPLLRYVDQAVDEFREKFLLTGVEPPWSLSKAEKLIELDNATHPVRVGEADVQEIGAVMEYAQVIAEMAPLEKRKKALAAEMRRVAAGAQVVTFGGQRAYEYKPVRRTKVDLDKLLEKHPQAYAECVTETESPTLYVDRAYKIKPKKEDR